MKKSASVFMLSIVIGLVSISAWLVLTPITVLAESPCKVDCARGSVDCGNLTTGQTCTTTYHGGCKITQSGGSSVVTVVERSCDSGDDFLIQ